MSGNPDVIALTNLVKRENSPNGDCFGEDHPSRKIIRDEINYARDRTFTYPNPKNDSNDGWDQLSWKSRLVFHSTNQTSTASGQNGEMVWKAEKPEPAGLYNRVMLNMDGNTLSAYADHRAGLRDRVGERQLLSQVKIV
jgi:hypothetical protein